MISFACPHCAIKLKVKPQFAGRSFKCPTCKQPLVVPTPPPDAQAFMPTGQIDGTPSSLVRAGVDGGVTLGQEPAARANGARPPSVQELLASHAQKGQRYLIEAEIARGGMGAVLRAVDCDIRREVAVKFMLDQADPRKKARFIEEAQITGQLEHPNVVPIHELGVDAQGRVYFSMKMVKGRSLAQVLNELRAEPGAPPIRSEKDWSLGRLLNIFVSVCNALAYAHSRGVVHRDLKPANIMIGDFGEVYVMDWGLAKVLRNDAATERHADAATGSAIAASGCPRVPASLSTSREPEADLTQEGSVMGTPVYMPPEQASGQVQAIDRRSDVYSLGAILYELLTQQPPIDKEGGYLAILMRVCEGEIIRPEQRAPERARAGKVPRELSAIAMKALALKREDRYTDVEALRKDIERFQEGRSVSAKDDTKREMIWKFIKRNQGFSAMAALALAILLCGLVLLGKAWWATSQAYSAYQKEQLEKEARTKKAVPAFVEAARRAAELRRFDQAMTQVDVALDYEPDRADARLLKGQLLVARKDFVGAQAELDKYLRLNPTDQSARELLTRCRTAAPEALPNLLALATLLTAQQQPTLAEALLTEHGYSPEARKQLRDVYQKRLAKAWPGCIVSMVAHGLFELNMDNRKDASSLEPLQGMLLTRLSLANCPLRDLAPLRGMPLTSLNLNSCSQVQDLTALRGLPLSEFDCRGCPVRDLVALQGMPLTSLFLNSDQVEDVTPLRGMPLATLVLNCKQVKDVAALKDMPLTSLNLRGCASVSDLRPLTGLKLTTLNLTACGLVGDLTPLRGMPVTNLDLSGCDLISDLTPLQGLPITRLELMSSGKCRVEDLTPLTGMPLKYLGLRLCSRIKSLAPLEGMNLEEIVLPPFTKGVSDSMAVLRRMKSLKKFTIFDRGASWSPEDFWKRYDAGEFK